MRIAQVAERSGFSAGTLRYYEQIGLLPAPERSPAGYRTYDEAVLTRLGFVARAKQLGCTLEEVGALLEAWDGGRCQPVQAGLVATLTAKLEETERRRAELAAFAEQLRATVVTLGDHTPDGACDDRCGCASQPIVIQRRPVPIACSLDGPAMDARLGEWQAVLARAADRTLVPGGVRLTFGADVAVTELVALADAERRCCAFLSFTLRLESEHTVLEVTGPPDAAAMVTEVFG
ncbi:MAG: putative MerR-family transcriptional regulator [Actinomycetia bacterium]|nr:putative MerR-family transcriptional regulator [Actinomycetes bacterium]